MLQLSAFDTSYYRELVEKKDDQYVIALLVFYEGSLTDHQYAHIGFYNSLDSDARLAGKLIKDCGKISTATRGMKLVYVKADCIYPPFVGIGTPVGGYPPIIVPGRRLPEGMMCEAQAKIFPVGYG